MGSDSIDTKLTWTPRGQLASMKKGSELTTYGYGPIGKLTRVTPPNGATLTFTYDTAHRLTGIEDVVNGVVNEWSMGQWGQTGSMGSDSIDTKLTWTPRGQLASMKKGSGEAGVKSSIKHLSMNSGQLTSMTYPSGRKLHYSYNAMGRIAKITITAGGQTQVLAKDIAYLPFGGITGLDYGNGTHLSQTYNQDYRLTKTETSNGFSRKYTYDADGNATVLTNTVSRPATPMAVSMAPDSNHIQSLSLNGGPYNPVTYDAAGRTVRQAGLKYVYYPSGRLFAVQSENADGSAQSLAAYAYSGLGRRVVTVRLDTPAQQTRHFMYDAAGHLIGVYQADGAPVHEIAYLNGRPLALFKGGNIYTIQTDRKDTPREIANAQGDVIWYLGGSAFDNFVVLYPQDVTIKLHLHLRFPGQYFDPASGNHYNGHRYYVPTTGRYLTPDPIGLAGGINPYRYVGDNPISYVDPLGLWQLTIAGGLGYGALVSVGHNSGQWNVGAYVGAGT
ncbi:MAG TPA: RHS repeat-associated core domain-containing protein, partial [Beutenbergiaceae bacterium]|nr:RHS repeat-associated core domain-containing protein [Beutenbergiaceae bacterium]